MRRTKLILTVAIAVLAVASAQAQVSFGVKGGLNITDMSLDSKVFETSNRMGFFAGPVLKVGLPLAGFGFDIAGLYDQREAKINDETVTQKSILVPANLRFSFGVGNNAGVYIAAGPQISFNIGDDEYTLKDTKTSRENAENTFQLKKSVFSVNVGGGVTFGHFEVGATYNIGVSKTAELESFDKVADTVYENRKATSNTWQIHAAFFF